MAQDEQAESEPNQEPRAIEILCKRQLHRMHDLKWATSPRRRSSCLCCVYHPSYQREVGVDSIGGTSILSLPDRDHDFGLCRASPANTAKDRLLSDVSGTHPNPWEWERIQVDVGKCLTHATNICKTRMMTKLISIILGDAKWVQWMPWTAWKCDC